MGQIANIHLVFLLTINKAIKLHSLFKWAQLFANKAKKNKIWAKKLHLDFFCTNKANKKNMGHKIAFDCYFYYY